MTEAEISAKLERFRYLPPGDSGASAVVPLAESSVLEVDVHVLRTGGEAIERDGQATETLWWVLSGVARVLDTHGAEFGEFADFQGVVAPRGVSCRIEPVGDAPVELLRIAAVDPLGREPQVEVSTTLLPIRYESPELSENIKVTYSHRSEDMLTMSIEKVRDGGGDDRPHAHFGIEGIWYLLTGRVRFHGATGEDAFEMTAGDGVYVPSGCAYGFGAIGHEPSEFLHIKALDLSADEHMRVDY